MTSVRHRDPRTTITAIAEEATSLGYRTREYEPFNAGVMVKDMQIMMDITGHGEVFEAYFRLKPTGYWAFWRGFRHAGPYRGDRYKSMRQFREAIQPQPPGQTP